MAADALAYLLKANLMLALFAAAYYGLLRRLTFFGLNRAYLAGALLFAALYPVLPVPALAPAATLLPLASSPAASPVVAAGPAGAPGLDWLALGLVGYGLGAAALLLRLLGQVLSLGLVRRRSRPAVALGQPVRVLAGAGGPFSFGRTIYLSEATLADAASLPAVLHHELAHVRQRHTLDVLLAQLATALAWPNPAAWLLRRALLNNLEYLADRAALRTGLNRRAYQYSLLRQQVGTVPAPALAFHFSFPILKNRITMLNQPTSATRQLGRYLLAAPLLMALGLGYSCSQKAEAPASVTIASQGKALTATSSFIYIDGQRRDSTAMKQVASSDIASVDVLQGAAARAYEPSFTGPGILFMTTKQNQNRPDVVALNAQLRALASAATASLAAKVAKLPADATYFLNGQASTRETIASLDSTTITRMDVLQGAQAAALAHDAKVASAISVVTK